MIEIMGEKLHRSVGREKDIVPTGHFMEEPTISIVGSNQQIRFLRHNVTHQSCVCILNPHCSRKRNVPFLFVCFVFFVVPFITRRALRGVVAPWS